MPYLTGRVLAPISIATQQRMCIKASILDSKLGHSQPKDCGHDPAEKVTLSDPHKAS